ncbi:MAG: aminoglycoside phosphotransferase family protein [Caulobacter sp.]
MALEFAIPDVVARRAALRGAEGEIWLDALPALVVRLTEEWNLRPDRVMDGGTEALVLSVKTAANQPAILKIAPPGEAFQRQLSVLIAASAECCPAVLAHEAASGTVLLEALGDALAASGEPINTQLGVLCDLLAKLWKRPPPPGLPTGADKARQLISLIEDNGSRQGRPVPDETLQAALAAAGRRASAFDPTTAVLGHGDAHAWNALKGLGGYRLIDPEGYLIEPAYDLGVCLREWPEAYLAGDPLALGRARCRWLAARTGVDAGAIWDWGLIESVTSGLALLALGLEEDGRRHLAVARSWAA